MIDRENNRQLYVKLKQRIHTAEVWKQINPILAPGEIGVEEFEGGRRFKCGDGTTPWNRLDYVLGDGVARKIFDGYDNEKTGVNSEIVGDLSNPDNVFKASQYKAELHPGEIIIVPRQYNKGTDNEFIMDTPYISLRKGGKWIWTVFADSKDKPVVSSVLGAFVLGASPLG